MKYFAVTGPAPALSRGIALIEWLAREGQASLENIARENNWPKSSTLRYLQALESSGIVEQNINTKAWILLKSIQAVHFNSTNPLEKFRRELTLVADKTRHCTELFEWKDGKLRLIDRAVPNSEESYVVARIGFKRDLSELEATTSILLAHNENNSNATGLWRWRSGEKCKVNEAEFKEVVETTQAEGFAMDLDFNSNGIRRFGFGITEPITNQLLGIFAVAQRQTPRAKQENETIIQTLKEIQNKLTK